MGREREREKILNDFSIERPLLYIRRVIDETRGGRREGGGGGGGGGGEMVDCSKLHQRRDNRVVDCVDRYSIFGELVAARRQPIARKIQLSLPT